MTIRLRPDNYARETLERYTGSPVEDFCSYVLLCNFHRYIKNFAQISGSKTLGNYWSINHDRKKDITIINYGVGSPSAGIIMHCLSFQDNLKTVLMLGMCGGIADDLAVGDLILPTASIRDEGTSIHYLPKNVPAQPTFTINRIAEQVISEERFYGPKSGIMHTTDYRMWEFDENFIDYILKNRIIAVDMETATIFAVAHARQIPTGALMLVSDLPLKKGGIKHKTYSENIFKTYTAQHLDIGIKVIEKMKNEVI
ncbi:MAG: AMP nucleosidase [Thermodesulfobacteriota bacterium]